MPETIKRRITVIGLFALLIISLLLMPTAAANNSEKPTDNQSSESSVFILKLQDDRVYLLKDGSPVKVYDIDISVLPGEDIGALAAGITVTSEAEGDSLAEDYDG